MSASFGERHDRFFVEMDKAKCQYEGCNAWPRKGQAYCVAHPDGQTRSVGGAPDGNQNARVHGLYSGFVSVEALQRAMEQPPDDLRLEIAAVRAAIDELLSMKGMDAGERLKALDKGMGALARLIRIQKQVSGDDGGDLDLFVADALKELGMGG